MINEPNFLLGVYGDVNRFRELQTQGYTEIAFGRGLSWVHYPGEDSLKLEGMYAIFHPEGKVTIYPRLLRRKDGKQQEYTPSKTELTAAEFEDLVKKLRIQMDEREDLSDFLDTESK